MKPICFKKFISDLATKNWLIIGKGPSFNDIDKEDLSSFQTISLNHVIKLKKVMYSHFIDYDAFLDCQDSVLENAEFLVMPFYPHLNNEVSKKSIIEFAQENKILNKLLNEKRVLSYDLISSKIRTPELLLIDGLFFSGEVVIKLLAASGVTNILTAGIDGGQSYSHAFSDLNEKTLLNNNQTTFSIQNQEISRTIIHYNLNLQRFKDRHLKYRVFVGAEEGQELAFKVLKYSIQINTPCTVEVHNLGVLLQDNQLYRQFGDFARTPFSFQRFFIPELCHFQGLAVYVDSDMQVFSDIRELFSYNTDTGLSSVQATPGRDEQNSVFLVDSSKIRWDLQKILKAIQEDGTIYKQILKTLDETPIVRNIPYHWNSLEHYSNETRLIHYTDMPTQPWIYAGHKHENVWLNSLNDSIREGVVNSGEILKGIRAQYLRPSLAWDVLPDLKKRIPSILKRRHDKKFTAPYLHYLNKWQTK